MDAISITNLNAISERIGKLKEAANSEAPLTDTLQVALMDEFSDLTQTEASSIVTGLERGIKDFNLRYNQAAASENGLRASIETAMEGMSDEEKFATLANMLAILRMNGGDTKPQDEQELNELLNEIKAGRVADAVTIENMLQEATEALANSDIMPANADSIKQIAQAGEGLNSLKEFCANEDSPLLTAVAAYAANRANEISLPDSLAESPMMLGAATAAGIQQLNNNTDLADGTISIGVWAERAKIALGILLGIALLAVGMIGLLMMSMSLLMPLFNLLGGGMLAMVVVTALGLVLSVGCSGGIVSLIYGILDIAGDIYDKLAGWIAVKRGKETKRITTQEENTQTQAITCQDETTEETTEKPRLIKA